MMKYHKYLILPCFTLFFGFCFAQTDTTFSAHGKPIVQVFATADFNMSPEIQKRYSLGLGRAHLGYQYWVNEKWNAKLIIYHSRAILGFAVCGPYISGQILP